MQYKILSLFFPLLLSFTSVNELPIKKNLIEPLQQGQILVFSTVITKLVKEKKIQYLNFASAVKLNAKCQKSLSNITQYESYKNYLSFVKESTYDIKEQLITFLISPPIFDFKFTVSFQLPRVQSPGRYPFIWKTGLFPNLQGTIFIFEEGIPLHCYIYLSGNWEGPPNFDNGISDILLEMMVETILKEGLEKLRVITLHHP